MLKMISRNEVGNTALYQFRGEMDGRQIRHPSLSAARQLFHLYGFQNTLLIVRGRHKQKTAAKFTAMFSFCTAGPVFLQLAKKSLMFIEP